MDYRMTIDPPSERERYLRVARSILPALDRLIEPPALWGPPVAILTGQALECALKAYLLKVGVTSKRVKELRKDHLLSSLLEEAELRGLVVIDLTRDWVRHVEVVHAKPYLARYMEEVDLVAFHLKPDAVESLREILDLAA